MRIPRQLHQLLMNKQATFLLVQRIQLFPKGVSHKLAQNRQLTSSELQPRLNRVWISQLPVKRLVNQIYRIKLRLARIQLTLQIRLHLLVKSRR